MNLARLGREVQRRCGVMYDVAGFVESTQEAWVIGPHDGGCWRGCVLIRAKCNNVNDQGPNVSRFIPKLTSSGHRGIRALPSVPIASDGTGHDGFGDILSGQQGVTRTTPSFVMVT